jgi:hypothetical protein
VGFGFLNLSPLSPYIQESDAALSGVLERVLHCATALRREEGNGKFIEDSSLFGHDAVLIGE